MREPATIPEYKQFCKALKLKILKQKTTIETQTQQIEKLNSQIKLLKKSGLQPRNQNDPNSALMSSIKLDKTKNAGDVVVDTETLQGKNQIMNKFKNGACSFGITPESIFRIADFAYKGEVEADYFRQVLSKIDLGLTPREISCLIYIFDENCTGFIHRDDYNDSLNAYEVSLEQSYLQYTSTCLEKLAKLLQVQKIPVIKFFQQMEGKNVNSVDLNKFSDKVRSTFGKKIQTRQIMGAFNAIDLQTDGIVCRKNFVYGITSAINKMSNLSSSVRKTNSFEDQQNHFQRSTLSNKKSAPANNTSSVIDNINEGSNSKTFKDIDAPQAPDTSDVLAKIFNTSKVTLHQIYEQICRNLLGKRLTLLQFRKILSEIQGSSKIEPQLSSQLFKAIDTTHKGSVFIRQLMQFYLAHETDMSIIFQLIAIYFKNNDLSADRFWFLFGVGTDADISKGKFMEVMGKAFVADQGTWDKLWQYFDKGRGVVSVATINKELSKYQIST